MADDLSQPPSSRDAETRRRDHAEIQRLADDVLPDLLGRLAASGLGEIEVREDDWRIRLRRPVVPPSLAARADRSSERAADRPERGADRPDRQTRAALVDAAASPGVGGGPNRFIAASPAVGVFQPRPDLHPGVRVRAGDRLGTVNLLGVPQEVVAPEDGLLVTMLVEAGEGVEYGQDLFVIDSGGRGRPGPDGATADSPAVVES